METPSQPGNTCRMTDHAKQLFRDKAFDLACETFGEPHEEVVEAIYERLVWNWERGLDDAGAVTIH